MLIYGLCRRVRRLIDPGSYLISATVTLCLLLSSMFLLVAFPSVFQLLVGVSRLERLAPVSLAAADGGCPKLRTPLVFSDVVVN